MTILITTANGKVGQELARQLIAQGAPVKIGAHNVQKAAASFGAARVVPFDYHDEASVSAALDGVTHLYLATPGDWPAEPEKRVIDIARSKSVTFAVKLSAMGVENTDLPLRQVERYLEASGLGYTILRPSWFNQNFSTGQAASIAQGILAEPSGDATTAFIDTRDIAAVAAAALTQEGHDGKIYGLTGGELLSRYDVARIIGETIGRTVTYIPQTDEQFREAMKPYLSPFYLELLSNLYAGVRAGWSSVITDTVEQVLGRPPISFRQFAEDYRAAWL
jgi:uncharacterized protein YbjT (DUF2867 family)